MMIDDNVIRDWVGAAPDLFAVTDVKKFNHDDRGVDVEAAEYVAPDKSERVVFDISELARLGREDKVIEHAVVALHPFKQRNLETIRLSVETDSVGKLFVLIWSRNDMVHTWLDGLRALNLHTQESTPASDPLLLATAKMIKSEGYNGLSSGHGKDAIVQLVRAYFVVGSSFRLAESVEKLVKEMKAGTKHRVTRR